MVNWVKLVRLSLDRPCHGIFQNWAPSGHVENICITAISSRSCLTGDMIPAMYWALLDKMSGNVLALISISQSDMSGIFRHLLPMELNVLHTPNHKIITTHVCDVSGVIVLTSSVCVCVCLCVTTLTAKWTSIQNWILVCWSSGRISRSSSKVKVIGQRSRSLDQKTFFRIANNVWNWIHSTPYMNGRATTWGVFKVYAFFY